MPLDGIVVSCLSYELNNRLIDSRIEKIYQPEKDELILLVRGKGKNERLLLSASSNNPRIHFTNISKANPDTPPMFCMLLRKHLTGGRITNIVQPNFERILQINIESYNEMGDLTTKKLILEIMGRHSNIILVDASDKIIDSIKHVDISVSSVRQVLPGLKYEFPPSQGKHNPVKCSKDAFIDMLYNESEGIKIDKFLVNSFTGISPLIAREICFLAFHNTDLYVGDLNRNDKEDICNQFFNVFDKVKNAVFQPVILSDSETKKVVDFSAIFITQYSNRNIIPYDSINEVLDTFYTMRDAQERLKQKSTDLLKIISNNLDRCKKKLSIQQQKMREVENREQFKIYGDLITANIYRISQGMSNIELENFYDESCPVISVPLNPEYTPSRNAQEYYLKYTKAKNAAKMVSEQMKLNLEEIEYLESAYDLLSRAESEKDINDIRTELEEQGYVKSKMKAKSKKTEAPSQPLRFISSDGFEILVGRNNKQNDYLTLRASKENDLWFHTKNIPGSHTVVKVNNKNDIPESTIFEAAVLAAYHSKGKASANVAVDYTKVKNVKKPSGAKPGMVIYENYKTVYVTPDEELVRKLKQKDILK